MKKVLLGVLAALALVAYVDLARHVAAGPTISTRIFPHYCSGAGNGCEYFLETSLDNIKLTNDVTSANTSVEMQNLTVDGTSTQSGASTFTAAVTMTGNPAPLTISPALSNTSTYMESIAPTGGSGATTYYGLKDVNGAKLTAATNAYGVYVDDNWTGGGTITNGYGLYVTDTGQSTTPTNNYLLYATDGTNQDFSVKHDGTLSSYGGATLASNATTPFTVNATTGAIASGAATVTGNSTVTGTFGVTGNTTLTGTLSESGAATLGSGTTNPFTVAATTGNVSTAGTLACGATTVTGDLTASGNVTGGNLITGGGAFSDSYSTNTNVGTTLKGQIADGSTAVANVIDNTNALTTQGAKDLSVRSNNVEVAYVGFGGAIVSKPGTLAAIGTCTSATEGGMATETNSTGACSAGATATNAGTTHCQIYCNGTNWIQTGR